jgi:hypothetical protein
MDGVALERRPDERLQTAAVGDIDPGQEKKPHPGRIVRQECLEP